MLTSAAVITFGSALLLNSSAILNLYSIKAPAGSEFIMGGAVGTAVAQALAGISALVLGILAITGNQPMSLNLVALLVMGAAILVTGNGMNNAVINMVRRIPERP